MGIFSDIIPLMKKLEKDIYQLSEKNIIIQNTRNLAIAIAKRLNLKENKVEAGKMAAKKKEINQVEEAAKRARSKAKQAAKQARDTAQCAKQSRAAVKKAREDAIRNVPGKIGMLQWPKASIVTTPSNNEDITVLGVDPKRTCLSIVVLINKIKNSMNGDLYMVNTSPSPG